MSQGTLFAGHPQERESALDQTIDTIRAKFGTASIQRGGLLDKATESDRKVT